MKLAHNFRNIFRKLASNYGNVSRSIIGLIVVFFFLISLFFGKIGGFLEFNNLKVLGGKFQPDLDVQKLVNEAALDISTQNFKNARGKIATVLVFDPDNVYALEMNRKLVVQISEINEEISETIRVVKMQPNWREAWLKLADLYDKAENDDLASEARKKARILKTS